MIHPEAEGQEDKDNQQPALRPDRDMEHERDYNGLFSAGHLPLALLKSVRRGNGSLLEQVVSGSALAGGFRRAIVRPL